MIMVIKISVIRVFEIALEVALQLLKGVSKRILTRTRTLQLVTSDDKTPVPGWTDELFACPISFQRMADPVTLCCSGHTYDRESISSWLSLHPCKDPFTNIEHDTPLLYVSNYLAREALIHVYGETAFAPYIDVKLDMRLGCFYETGGYGMQQDHDKALKHYESAASNNHFSYILGHGVQRDLGKALGYLKSAAGQGLREAQYDLGRFYECGMGTLAGQPKSVTIRHAIKYYAMAVEQNHGPAVLRLNGILRKIALRPSYDYSISPTDYCKCQFAVANAKLIWQRNRELKKAAFQYETRSFNPEEDS